MGRPKGTKNKSRKSEQAVGPAEVDAEDPALNEPIEDSEDDDAAGAPSTQSDSEEDPDFGGYGEPPTAADDVLAPVTLEIGPEEPEDVAPEPDLIEAIENPVEAPIEPEKEKFPAAMDELTVAKLTALIEKYGAKTFRASLPVKNRPQLYHLVGDDGNDMASGTLEELAFLALTFEPLKKDKAKPVDRDFGGPDPILKSSKRQPINSLHDLSIVLRDFGCKMTFDKVGDFYKILIFDQSDMVEPLAEGTVPVNATKADLTRFFWKAKEVLPK